MKYTQKELIEFTDMRIANWYEEVKLSYGIVGSGKSRIEGDEFIVSYIEDGVEKEWSLFYCEANNEKMDYYYWCWTSLC